MFNILIVDDDAGQLDLFETAFKLGKFKVDVAQSGEEGLQKISEKKYDLVLLDFVMPGLTGMDVVKKIRSNPELKNLKLVLMTNLSRPGLVEEAFSVGVDDFFMKSDLTPTQILERVQKVVEKNKN